MQVLETGQVQNVAIRCITFDIENPGDDQVAQDVLRQLAACANSLPLRIEKLHFCTQRKNKGALDPFLSYISDSNKVPIDIHIGKCLGFSGKKKLLALAVNT